MSKFKISDNPLPAPRLELVWTPNTDPTDTRTNWLCDYNLVIPLDEHDIRRERADGTKRSELVLKISTTRVSGAGPVYDDHIATPFRDGAHAMWDAIAMRGIPVYAVHDDEGFLVSEDVPMVPRV